MATSDEERAHLEGLIADHTKRLHALQRQAARQGNNTPPDVTVEIADIQKEIASLQARIEPAIDQIRHPFVRGFLERAVAYAAVKKYEEAAGEALGGLLWTLRMVGRAVLGHTGRPAEDNGRIETMALFHALNLNYPAYLRITNQVGTVKIIPGGTHVVLQRISLEAVIVLPEIGHELASQTLMYCTRAIASIETQAGDLDRPFGVRGIIVP